VKLVHHVDEQERQLQQAAMALAAYAANGGGGELATLGHVRPAGLASAEVAAGRQVQRLH
jgi:hypothetical protein